MSSFAVGPKVLSVANDEVTITEAPVGSKHAMVIKGSGTTPVVWLEGSMDGITWFQLTITAASVGATVVANAATTTGVFASTTQVPLPFIRARLVSIAAGSVTVGVVSDS